MNRITLLVGILFLSTFTLVAQDNPTAEIVEPTPTEVPPEKEDLVTSTMAQDINSMDYYELLQWAKSLGIEATGGVEDLRKRLQGHFKVLPPEKMANPDQTITIDSAYGTHYFTLERVDENYIKLTGGVSLTLRDNKKNVDHQINADEILFNQTKNNLTARGRVLYVMTKDGSKETFRGESLTFNLDDWRGIFYDGVSSRKRSVGGSELDFSFSGDTIKRNQSDMVVLQNGQITSSDPVSPYYRIQAEKIWIMAPGEWGLLNAVLYVGRIPVFYFPFFYQPGDEMFFNPVLGLPTAPDRRGSFLQTTTYFLGTKKKESSPLSFLQIQESESTGSDKTKISGLYLVKDPDAGKTTPKLTGSKDDLMKVILDIYTNLGVYSAWEGSMSNLGPLKKITFLSAFAYSFNVYQVNGYYTPFKTNTILPDVSIWEQWTPNKSYFFGLPVPFRYALEYSVDTDFLKLNWEYYSDPKMSSDFRDRSENFSMFSLIGFGPKTTTVAEKSSLFWKGEIKISPQISFLNPWVKSLSINNVFSSLDWTRKNESTINSIDPAYNWFAPSRATVISFNISASGDLLGAGKPSVDITSPALKKSEKSPFDLPPLTSPWESLEKDSSAESKNNISTEPLVTPPSLQGNIVLGGIGNVPGTVSLTYSYSPRVNIQSFLNVDKWNTPEDVDWKSKYSQALVNEDGNLGLNISFGPLGTLDESVTYLRSFRKTYDIHDSILLPEKTGLLAGDAQNSIFRFNQSLKLTSSPFQTIAPLKASQLSYTLSTRLWESKYLSFDSGESIGLYDNLLPQWTPEGVTTHEASASIVISPFSSPELLKLSTSLRSTLEPREIERSLNETLSFQWDWVRAAAASSQRFTVLDRQWHFDPLKLNLDLGKDQIKLSNSLEYDNTLEKVTNYTANLVLYNLNGRYTSAYIIPSYFDNVSRRWVQSGTQEFVPRDAQISYRLPTDKIFLWKNRIEMSGTVNTSLNFDLQRITNSPFSFELNWALKLFQALDFSITTRSTNKAVFRYFPGMVDELGLNLPVLNPVDDLVKSFMLWDETARRESNFKLADISLKLTHSMPDWTFNYTYTGHPEKNTVKKQYEWVTSFSFSVLWKPIPEIKNETSVDNKDNYTVKTTS